MMRLGKTCRIKPDSELASGGSGEKDEKMAHVKCKYSVEDEEGCFEDLFLEGDYKKVAWDGEILLVGNKRIRSRMYYENNLERTGYGYLGGYNDIWFLQIDDDIYIDRD